MPVTAAVKVAVGFVPGVNVTARLSESAPLDCGVNATLMAQLARFRRVGVQEVFATLKLVAPL